MAFRFRLASVLRQKKRIEDQRALVLATAASRRDAVAAEHGDLRRQTETYRQALVAAATRGTTGVELRVMAESAHGAWRRARASADRLAVEASNVDVARRELVTAARERHVMEHLEEIHRADFAHRSRLTEQRQLDDLAATYHRWRRDGEWRR